MKPLHTLLVAAAISISTASCGKNEDTATTPEESQADQSAAQSTDTQLASTTPMQDQISQGEEAHEVHCYKCHTDEVYTRENRFVKSIDALSKQVVRCKDGNDVPWFDADTEAVVQFLNNKYYRF